MKWRKEYKWQIFKALLDPTLKYFCFAALIIILVGAVSAWFAGYSWALYGHGLLYVLLIAFLGVFPSSIMSVLVETNSTKGFLLVNVIRVVITATLILGTSVLVDPTGSGISLGTIVRFLIIYAAFSVYSYLNATNIEIKDKKVADEINQKLSEFHNGKNETHID